MSVIGRFSTCRHCGDPIVNPAAKGRLRELHAECRAADRLKRDEARRIATAAFSSLVRTRRTALGMDRKSLALKIQDYGSYVSDREIGYWEQGKSQPWNLHSDQALDLILSLERALKIETGDLFLSLEASSPPAGLELQLHMPEDARMTVLAAEIRRKLAGSDRYAVKRIEKQYTIRFPPGGPSRITTRISQTIRALEDNVDQSIFIYTVGLLSNDSLTTLAGCSVGRKVGYSEALDGDQRIGGVALHFNKVLKKGEHHEFTFEAVEDGGIGCSPEPRIRHLQGRPCEQISLHLAFDNSTNVSSLSEKRWHIATLREVDVVKRIGSPAAGEVLSINVPDVPPSALGWDWRWQK